MPDITAAQLERLKELIKLQERGQALTSEERRQQQEILAVHGSSVTALGDIRDVAQQIAEQRRKDSTALKEQLQLLKNQNIALNTMGRSFERNQLLLENQLEQERNLIETAREQIALQDESTVAGRAIIANERDQIAIAQDRINLLNRQNAASGRASELIEAQLGGTLGLVGAMDEYTQATEAGQRGMYLLAGAIKQSAGAFNFILGSIKSMVMGAHIAEKQFEKTFQLPAEYTTRLHENYKALNQYGVSAEEASAATGDLVMNVTEFTMASGAQQDSLVKTTALLAETGIASADVAKGVQTSMKMFGQSIQGAETTALELAAVARELQVVPGEMAAQYAAMGPQLAKFGREGISTFKELSRIQKLTGMEMGKVLQIASKFDTFEDAATATGKLNAALGGNFVNAMDMMMDTDPASRFETIRGAIENAGLSFDTMSYYQKQFYTDALGLSDVGDLALMLSGRTDLMTDATDASAESYEKQAERAKSVQNIQEQLQNILADNADEFLKLATIAAKFLHFLSDNMWMVKNFTRVLFALKVVQIGMIAVNTAAAAGWWGFTASMSAADVASRKAKFGIGLLVVALIALAVLGLLMRSPSLLVLTLVALAGALWLTSKILSKSAPAMAKAGAGMTTFGAGLMSVITPIAILIVSVALLAAGIGYMASSFGEMFNALSPEKMALVTTFLLSFGSGAIGMVAAGVGLIAFAIGMGALAFALRFIATDDLTAIATIMKSIGEIPTGGMGDSASGIRGIATAIDEITIDSLSALEKTAVAFSNLGSAVRSALVPLQSLMTSMSALQTDNIAGLSTAMQGTVDALNEIPLMKTMVLSLGFGKMALAAASLKPIALAFAAGGGATGATRASGAAASSTTATAAGGGTSAQNITVRLELDGKLLEEKVVKIMGDQYRPIFAGQG